MARHVSERSIESTKQAVLLTASRLFLEKGYSATSLREIAKESGVNIGSLMYFFESKENILCELVTYALESQFHSADALLRGVTDDKVLFWATETALQLYMAESGEQIRELYIAAYSMPKSTGIIQHTIAEKMEFFFKDYRPEYEAKDFYEMEIGTCGIIRGYMSVPCDMYFTMEHKVKRFLEMSLLVYGVPEEKRREAIEFVARFDFEALARQLIDSMLKKLDELVLAAETQNAD